MKREYWKYFAVTFPYLRRHKGQVAAVRPTGKATGRVFIYDANRDRTALAAALIGRLRRGGLHVVPANGWEDHDAHIAAGPCIRGELLAVEHPHGSIQVRVRRRARKSALTAAALIAAVSLTVSVAAFAALAATAGAAVLWGIWRTGPSVERLLTRED